MAPPAGGLGSKAIFAGELAPPTRHRPNAGLLRLVKWTGSFGALIPRSLSPFLWQFSGRKGRLEQSLNDTLDRMTKMEQRLDKLDERSRGPLTGSKTP